jgi:4-amino-4-deoxy-L-arabinose transferase-like glycosyltransferase
VLVAGIVLLIYLPRLTALPVCGEESRWATAAREMLRTGDWLVPRQQGQVFPDRPPLGMWPMAAIGGLRGDVDAWAIRLPSVLAVLATSLLVCAYASQFLSRWGALLAGLAYPTMGQVLQLGGLGESDAQFAFYVTASLLVWHAGYQRKLPPEYVWAAGYALAALGALVKGLQAPAYFVGATWFYLVVQRDWRWLVSWRHFLGSTAFVVVLGAWQIPYIFATGWTTGLAMWTNGPTHRFHLDGLLLHLATYPVETLVCTLPWSPLLLIYFNRAWRKKLGDAQPFVLFVALAAAVCYPSVWLAATARGRYFMPLYPCLAVLAGVIFERVLRLARGTKATMVERGQADKLAACRYGWRRPALAAGSVLLLGLVGRHVMLNAEIGRTNDPTPAIAAAKQSLPQPERLVSFTAIDHRFDYYYGQPIAELPWPKSLAEVPPRVEYFCFTRTPGDTPAQRKAGRFWNMYTTSGTLPFAWEPVAEVSMTRRQGKNQKQPAVIVGRIVRDGDTRFSTALSKPANSARY